MMKKEIIIGSFVALILGFVSGFLIFSPSPAIAPQQEPTVATTAEKTCPDEWYNNQMPTTVGSNNPPAQYFVVNGERRELSEFDVDWIKENCAVNKPTVVQ